MSLAALIICACSLISITSASTESIYRLSKALIPLHYSVTLHHNLDSNITYDFEGYEYIQINITSDYIPSNDDSFQIRIHQGPQVELMEITLNVSDTIHSATGHHANTETQITNISFPISNNDLITAMNSNSFIISTLYIKYVGLFVMSDGIANGIFTSTYTYNDILIKNIVTQFEPVGARNAFPCFDEPAMKSIFQFTFIAPINATVLYNTPVESMTIIDENNDEYDCYYEYHTGLIDDKCIMVTFEPSPLMSTYLNTWVIGDYQAIEGINPYFSEHENVVFPQNLYYPWFRPITDAQWSYNASLFAIYYFGSEDVFNFSFTEMLPKEDDISLEAITWAMEHWGLVTYGSNRLMTNPLTADLAQRISCSVVIGHEAG